MCMDVFPECMKSEELKVKYTGEVRAPSEGCGEGIWVLAWAQVAGSGIEET